MTTGILIEVIRRRWVVVALGIALTLFACMTATGRDRTYGATTDLLLVQPGKPSLATSPDSVAPSLIAFAGMVQQSARQDSNPIVLPSSATTLFGSGVTTGYSITLPNAGSQWTISYTRPVLAIQVVGTSPNEVRKTLNDVISLVEFKTLELQRTVPIPNDELIEVKKYPTFPDVVDLGSTKGEYTKGVFVLFVLGLTLTGIGATQIERLLKTRESSRVLQ